MKRKKGIISLLPSFLQRPALRLRYAAHFGGWSPFPLPNYDRKHWPKDMWQGDGERGRAIFDRRFVLAGCDISFPRRISWYAKEGSAAWLRAMHSFAWMRDVVAYSDNRMGGEQLGFFIDDWIATGDNLHAVAMEPDIRGERLAHWLCHVPFILKETPKAFQRRFLASALKQTLALEQVIVQQKEAYGLPALKGWLLATLCLPGCAAMYKEALRMLLDDVRNRRYLETAPQARSPLYLHDALRDMITIRDALQRLAKHSESALDVAIKDLAQRIRYLSHGDGKLAVFQGGIEGDAELLAETLAHVKEESADVQGFLMERLGYGRMHAEKTVVLVDAAVPDHTNTNAYFSTMAFEMSHESQRMIVKSGAFIGNDAGWSRAMKSTAAHSAVCVDDRNSCQFRTGVGEEEQKPRLQRRLVEREGYLFFEGVYDGYAPYAGLTHTRQLLLNHDGTRFSGSDQLVMDEDWPKPRSHDVNLRFHLHPAVSATRMGNGNILLSSGAGKWLFQSSVGTATELEESIYLGMHSKPVISQQIIIYVPFSPGEEWLIEWSFIKH